MKLGIIGSGKIIEDALFAIEPLKEISLNAIFVRPHSIEKGKAFSEKYGIKEVYTDYEELLEKADIDTVYIGLINSVHYEYAKKAVLKKKHVILEKPFVGTYDEAIDLVNTAKENNCVVLEAITVLHNDVIDKMKNQLSQLGNIKMMIGNYSQYSSRYDRYLNGDVDHSFDPDYLGGTLRDINVYNVHYVIYLFGRPQEVEYHANKGFNGIDTSGVLVLKYDGFSAVCIAAKDSDSPCFISIQGEKGYMKIDGKPNVAPNLTINVIDENNKELVRDPAGATVRASIKEEYIPPVVHHRMTREFKDFADIIDQKDFETANQLMNESVDVMYVIDKAINQ